MYVIETLEVLRDCVSCVMWDCEPSEQPHSKADGTARALWNTLPI